MAPIPPAASAPEPLYTVAASVALSYLAYRLTASLVPLLGPDLISKGLGGVDMLKPGFVAAPPPSTVVVPGEEPPPKKPRPKGKMLPEATGVIGASVYILLLTLFAPLPYLAHLLPPPPPPITQDLTLVFPHHSFATYLASLLSLLTATFLGFMDDVFDIRWRFKIPIPVIASVPLLVTYAAGHGITDVVIPRVLGLRKLLDIESTSGVLRLGPLYYFYMSLLSTFCTNSINILAGVNGVEVGQALVIALSIALNDLLYISFDLTYVFSVFSSSSSEFQPYIVSAGFARGSEELADRHLFSLYFMLPLIGVCLGLLKHNWYPARAFIGDTFCYFSGMAFAVVGILGHFSKTLLLFFLPQIFNFLYSSPQLFGVLPCPRHRLPKFNATTNLLNPSFFELPRSTTPKRSYALVEILSKLHLVDVKRNEKGEVTECSNLTILNLLLVWFGPMGEESLSLTLVGVQVVGSAVAMGVRHGGAGVFYDSGTRN